MRMFPFHLLWQRKDSTILDQLLGVMMTQCDQQHRLYINHVYLAFLIPQFQMARDFNSVSNFLS